MNVKEQIIQVGKQAVKAAHELAGLSSRRKNSILEAMAEELEAQKNQIIAENAKDVEAGVQAGLSPHSSIASPSPTNVSMAW